MNYNSIAPYYDILSRICFINRQQIAHQPILKYLKNGDRILWLGGGSGWFLEEMDQLNLDVTIDFIEFSSMMISKAQSRKLKHIKVNFIQIDMFNFIPQHNYNIIITAFIFDHFPRIRVQKVFDQLEPKLIQKGIWFYVDFVSKQNTWQKLLSRSMIYFFDVIAKMGKHKFPQIEDLFDVFQLSEEHFYFFKYITCKIYIK